MDVVVENPMEFQKRFCTDLQQAERNASNLAELFKRLRQLGEDCVGMKVSFGGKPFIIEREGKTFILVEFTER